MSRPARGARDAVGVFSHARARAAAPVLRARAGYGDKMSDMFKVMPIFLTNTLKTAEDVEVAEQAEADGGGLTPEIAEEVYRSMNTDGSAGLDKEELRQGLEKMNLPNVNRIMAYQLFKTADANGDGLIDLGEFQDLIATIQAGSMETDVARMRAPGPASALMNLPPARAAAACVARARDAFVASFPGTCAGYARLAARAKAVAEGERFDQLIIFCIMLVGVATFVQMEFNRDGEASAGVRLFLDVVGYVTLAVFTVEVVVKIVARGDAPAGFFTDPAEGAFNSFDFAVVAVSYAMLGSGDGGIVAVCRLLRLIKIMNKVPQLRVILLGLVAGLRAVGSVMMLMGLVMFLYGIVGNLYFGANDPANFGGVAIAILTLFRVSTLAGWSLLYKINYFGCDRFDAGIYTVVANASYAVPPTIHTNGFGDFDNFFCNAEAATPQPVAAILFFYTYTVVTAYVILSLFISVITAAMFEVMEMNKRQKLDQAALLDSPESKRQRLERSLKDANSEIRRNLDFFFGTHAKVEVDVNELTPKQKVSHYARCVAEHPKFQSTVLCAILVVGALEVLAVEKVGDGATRRAIEHFILAIFTFECVVKLLADGPAGYFADAWNKFDSLVVAFSYVGFVIDMGSITVLRLIRLLRVMRMLNSVPTLRSVTESLMLAFGNVGYVMLMIMIVNFIFAVIGMVLFAENDPEHFGHIPMALMTIWMIETLDAWEDIMYINMYGCANYGYVVHLQPEDVFVGGELPPVRPPTHPYRTAATECDPDVGGLGWLAALYMLVVVLLGGMVLPTVLIGVISIAFDESTTSIKDEVRERAQEAKILLQAMEWDPDFVTDEQIDAMRIIFRLLNSDATDERRRLRNAQELMPVLAHVCQQYAVPLEQDRLEEIYDIIDQSSQSELAFPELLWFMVFVKRVCRDNELRAADDDSEGSALATSPSSKRAWSSGNGAEPPRQGADPGKVHPVDVSLSNAGSTDEAPAADVEQNK